jgi:acylphosphatase
VGGEGLVAKKVLFRGDVQGVGFRFTAVRAAQGYDVTGYVRNLPDGRVEMVAEGHPKEVDAFIDLVRAEMSGYIAGDEFVEAAATGAYPRFGVRY